MNTQDEATLEENLIKQLESLDYERVYIKDEKELLENLKIQLEIHNKTTLSQAEFQRVLNHLNKGDIFEKAKILRDKYALLKDDNKTNSIY